MVYKLGAVVVKNKKIIGKGKNASLRSVPTRPLSAMFGHMRSHAWDGGCWEKGLAVHGLVQVSGTRAAELRRLGGREREVSSPC